MRTPIQIASSALALVLATGVAAASRTNSGGVSVYAAFPLVSMSPIRTRHCGSTVVTTGTYRGTSTSPDPRLAGRASLALELGVNPASGYGYALGSLTIRDGRGQARLRGRLTGVVSNRNVVNGIVIGTLTAPNALLIANLSIVFNETFTFAAVRMGVESGDNSAVAYTAPRCR